MLLHLEEMLQLIQQLTATAMRRLLDMADDSADAVEITSLHLADKVFIYSYHVYAFICIYIYIYINL